MGVLSQWRTVWRHARMEPGDVRRALDAAALARVQAAVAASETRHSGEIRVSVEAALPLSYLRRGLGSRARAVTLFGKLGVWDTEHNNGVLIYLLLADHAIEIVADRGLARHVSQSQWDALIAGMRENFLAQRFEAGLLQAVAAVDALLMERFALAPGEVNPNELPDGVDQR